MRLSSAAAAAADTDTEHVDLRSVLKNPAYTIQSTASKGQRLLDKSTIFINDIIGSQTESDNTLRVFHYPICKRKNYRKRKEITIKFDDNPSLLEAKEFVSRALNWRPRKYLVVLNPYGGAKLASSYLERVVAPMFIEAEITFEVIVTRYNGHAQEIGRTFEHSKYTGIVTISGDGTLHEIINGISERGDGTKITDIPIGILNGGTANCMVAAILEKRQERGCKANKAIWNATFAFIKGQSQLVDIMSVEYGEQLKLYLCQSLSWGLICDVEFESEWLRILGSNRYTIYALKHILLNKSHEGTIEYIPESILNTSTLFQEYLSTRQRTTEYHQGEGGWRSLRRQDFSFAALMVNGFWSLDNIASPFLDLDDTNGYLMLVPKPISRRTLLKIFLNLESGKHAFYPEVEWICVRKVRFEFSKEKELNFDGELFKSAYMQCDIVPRAINLVY